VGVSGVLLPSKLELKLKLELDVNVNVNVNVTPPTFSSPKFL